MRKGTQEIPKKFTRECFENLYFNKLENLEEMRKNLDIYDSQKNESRRYKLHFQFSTKQ
jgi:hypothetical protein